MRNYKSNDPKGWGGDPSRGAALGRSSITEEDSEYSGKVNLRRVYLDAGGYDSNGTYFGDSRFDRLYWCSNDEGTIDFMVRGKDRNEAKSQVRNKYPSARFYR